MYYERDYFLWNIWKKNTHDRIDVKYDIVNVLLFLSKMFEDTEMAQIYQIKYEIIFKFANILVWHLLVPLHTFLVYDGPLFCDSEEEVH